MPRRMSVITFVIILAIAAGVGFGLLILLDDDDSKAALTEYFQNVAPVVNSIDDRSSEQVVREPNQVFATWGFVVFQTVNDLQDIDPPGDVAEAHQELMNALSDAAVELARLGAENQDVETLEEAALLRNQDEELRAVEGRARTACAELEQIADENDIPVDLELC